MSPIELSWTAKKTKESKRKESVDESNIRFLKMEMGRNYLWLVCSPTGTFCHKQPGNMARQLKSKSERDENSYWQVIFCSFPKETYFGKFSSSPESALSFSFKVDNKLQRMRSAVHLRGKTCCSQIHLFDIIVLADPCARPSEFLVLNISVSALTPSSPPPSCTKTWQGVPPPSGPQHPIKISVGTGAFVAVKSGKFRHKMSHYHPLTARYKKKLENCGN